jgi:hypothetical protein
MAVRATAPVWSVAEGRRGRRWREVVSTGEDPFVPPARGRSGRALHPPRALDNVRAAHAPPRRRRDAPRQSRDRRWRAPPATAVGPVNGRPRARRSASRRHRRRPAQGWLRIDATWSMPTVDPVEAIAIGGDDLRRSTAEPTGRSRIVTVHEFERFIRWTVDNPRGFGPNREVVDNGLTGRGRHRVWVLPKGRSKATARCPGVGGWTRFLQAFRWPRLATLADARPGCGVDARCWLGA